MTATAPKSNGTPKVLFPSGACAITNALLIADIVEATGASTETVWDKVEKVCCKGKAYTLDLDSLANLGLPIWQWLCNRNDVDLDTLKTMVKEGEVTEQIYLAAIRDNIGGLARFNGKTELYAAGGLISDNYSLVEIANNTGRPEYIVPKREGEKATRRLERILRKLLAPTKADPYFRRGTPALRGGHPGTGRQCRMGARRIRSSDQQALAQGRPLHPRRRRRGTTHRRQ